MGCSLRSVRPVGGRRERRSPPGPVSCLLVPMRGSALCRRASRDARRLGRCAPRCGSPSRPCPPGYTGTRLTACNLCEAICGLELTLTDGQVTGIRGNPAGPALARLHLPQGRRARRRVRRPRPAPPAPGTPTGDDWVEIGWDEALDLVADRLAETINRHGRDAVGVYLGNPNVHALGSATHARAVREVAAAPATGSARRRSTRRPHQLVAWQLFGHQLLIPIPDLDRTSYFLVLGANPMASNGSLMTAPDFPSRARAIKERGGRIVVLDPRRTETAKIATEHHFVAPGLRRGRAARDAAHAAGRGPRPPAGVRRRRSSGCATLVEPFTPSSPSRSAASRPTTMRADHPRVLRGRRGGGVRPGGRLDHRLRLALPLGDQLPQPAVRALRPARAA